MNFEKHYAMCTDLAAQHRRFFTSLGRLLETAEGQMSYDSAEFLSRRLRENERTLFTFTLRMEQALPNEVEVFSDLNELVFLVNELPRDFDRIVEDSERSTFTAPSSLNDRLSTAARNGLVSRPRLQILQQQLQTLNLTCFSYERTSKGL